MNKRIVEIDILRGFAAAAVVLFHYTYQYNIEVKGYQINFPFEFTYGHLGVELFFVISGFVIIMSVEKHNAIKPFIISRFSRLFPAFWVTSLFVYIITMLAQFENKMIGFKLFLLNLTMINGLTHKTPTFLQDVYWTLSSEMNFYFLVIIIIWLNLLKKINTLIIIGIVIYFFLNYFNSQVPYFIYIYKYIFILNNLPLFFAGILFYKLSKKDDTRLILYLYLFLNYLVYAYFHGLRYSISLALFYLVFILILNGSFKFVINRFTVFFGTISYALYLVHQNIGYILLKAMNQLHINIYLGLTLILFIVIFLAYLITRYIEKPFIIIIRKKMTSL
jgi:peptidoglycan/LPS O-acetylase OafA/YrhL